MKTILITGGTGLIGKHLAPMLKEKGYKLHLLSRNSKPVYPFDAVFTWNYKTGTIDKAAFKGVTHVIHLAGAGIADQNWTHARKKEILESRVNTAALLLDCLKEQSIQLEAFIGGSAIGWYGAQTESLLHTEIEPAAADFMGETCKQWEDSAFAFGDCRNGS
jgi:NAD dependent epimerase/dehydratase family enzyme